MLDYLAIKHIHLTCVALSGAGFLLRGVWMLADSPRLQTRWVKVVPHVVDTGLLASAIALAVISQQYPIAQGWLTAKVIGLLAYIGFGTMALKRGKTKGRRTLFLVLALLTFAYIVGVALTRSASLRLL
ncbi:MAG TPA: SirB2 family protein [Rhodocyclaceae bacterium]|nr:SirB2 family protein [Rhodocyclaceae bacterium]